MDPGRLRRARQRIDVGGIGIDSYVVGGLTDHITPWHGVYQTARLYGRRRTTFALSNGGHIQSLVNPPGNARPGSWPEARARDIPEGGCKRREKREGSWWPHWREWIQRAVRRACKRTGGASAVSRHRRSSRQPGTYVLER